jgi:hypothetical protein
MEKQNTENRPGGKKKKGGKLSSQKTFLRQRVQKTFLRQRVHRTGPKKII